LDTVEQLAARKPAGLVWIDSPLLVLFAVLEQAFKARARVHWGRRAPEEAPSAVIYYSHDEDVAAGVRRLRHAASDAPILVFGPHADLRVAREALLAGARGFVHAQMPPEQIFHAFLVAREGNVVVPSELLKEVTAGVTSPDLSSLPPRKLEVLKLVAEGLSNAQIAERLFLSEVTVKQHLRIAYKLLGVKNRVQAAALYRQGGMGQGQ
jgi:DNA-binding NarL/FixJ family response regulator